jgi:hypothetical protein
MSRGYVRFAKKYGAFLNDSPSALNVTRFSDEAHFRLSASENAMPTVANPTWYALSSVRIFGPVFIHGTVTSVVYLGQPNDEFTPILMRHGQSNEFCQVSTRLWHTSHQQCRTFFAKLYGERVLSNRYPALFEEGFSWPSTSPDMHPCECVLWGYLKNRVFQKNWSAILELNTVKPRFTNLIRS